MARVTPLSMTDYAVLAALSVTAGESAIESVAAATASPARGPGVSLSPDSVRRIMVRLRSG
ncbi:hypothetical protein ACFVUS_07000 [Nocardia sp. NPDC058058]|uniref:hypothetical protein n=1 Tax=Nocardia sp. NPDC058058 TaxID=3346317 RepID=UPI0036DCD444